MNCLRSQGARVEGKLFGRDLPAALVGDVVGAEFVVSSIALLAWQVPQELFPRTDPAWGQPYGDLFRGSPMNSSTTSSVAESQFVTGISLPDSVLVQGATEFIQDTESALLFNHSSRVFCFASLAGRRRSLKFDAELL